MNRAAWEEPAGRTGIPYRSTPRGLGKGSHTQADQRGVAFSAGSREGCDIFIVHPEVPENFWTKS